jgi:hypothetical protein
MITVPTTPVAAKGILQRDDSRCRGEMTVDESVWIAVG